MSHFWCFPFLISPSLDCDSRGQGRRKGFTASSGQWPELQDLPGTATENCGFCSWGCV